VLVAVVGLELTNNKKLQLLLLTDRAILPPAARDYYKNNEASVIQLYNEDSIM